MNKLAVYNRALAFLGRNRLMDAEDMGESRVVLDGLYEDTLRFLLEEYAWGWARRHACLCPVEHMSGEWPWCAGLPDDFVRMVDPESIGGEWMICGSQVLMRRRCSAEFFYVAADWVRQVTDEVGYGAMFAEALACKLAADAAMPLGAGTQMMQGLMAMYAAQLLPAAIMFERRNESRRLVVMD